MYGWIWRHLPGPAACACCRRCCWSAAVCALLLFVVFPLIEPRLPSNPVTGPGTVGQ